jgi:hypothetical protein
VSGTETAERVTTAPPSERMRHYLHHFEGVDAVAYCGFRRANPSVSVGEPAECVVCAEMWRAEFGDG